MHPSAHVRMYVHTHTCMLKPTPTPPPHTHTCKNTHKHIYVHAQWHTQYVPFEHWLKMLPDCCKAAGWQMLLLEPCCKAAALLTVVWYQPGHASDVPQHSQSPACMKILAITTIQVTKYVIVVSIDRWSSYTSGL